MPTVEDYQNFVTAILGIPPEQAAALFATSADNIREESKPRRKLTDEDLETYRKTVEALLG